MWVSFCSGSLGVGHSRIIKAPPFTSLSSLHSKHLDIWNIVLNLSLLYYINTYIYCYDPRFPFHNSHKVDTHTNTFLIPVWIKGKQLAYSRLNTILQQES
jgi:hypothetical protein